MQFPRGVVLAWCLLPLTPPVQGAGDKVRREFEKKRIKFLVEAGQRHLLLGDWCRKANLIPQATAEFVLAVEISEGHNQGANTVLGIMRAYDDAFWKRGLPKPGKLQLDSYADRLRRVRQEDRKERLALAAAAWNAKLLDAAVEQYRVALRTAEEPIVVDARGRVVIDNLPLPEEISTALRQDKVKVNGQERLPDLLASRVPQITPVFEKASDTILVRSQVSLAQAEDLHGLGTALLPHLEDLLDGRPARRLQLYVLADRKGYAAYLDAVQLAEFKAASAFADMGTFAAVVCAEGMTAAQLHATVLHELTHLFQFGVSPVVMPSWYCEGLAETFGGEGTHTWSDGKLTVGGDMARARLDALKQAGVSLKGLMEQDALKTVAGDKAAGAVFYAGSWALMRFLRRAAGKSVAEKFALWEQRCRGAALGAEIGKPNARNTAPAAELFQKTFSRELPTLEQGFAEWLQRL